MNNDKLKETLLTSQEAKRHALREVRREIRTAFAYMWFLVRKRFGLEQDHHCVFDSAYGFGTDTPRGRDLEFLWCRCGNMKYFSR